jgi:hypothetical protein
LCSPGGSMLLKIILGVFRQFSARKYLQHYYVYVSYSSTYAHT